MSPLISIPAKFIRCIKRDLEYNNLSDNQAEQISRGFIDSVILSEGRARLFGSTLMPVPSVPHCCRKAQQRQHRQQQGVALDSLKPTHIHCIPQLLLHWNPHHMLTHWCQMWQEMLLWLIFTVDMSTLTSLQPGCKVCNPFFWLCHISQTRFTYLKNVSTV